MNDIPQTSESSAAPDLTGLTIGDYCLLRPLGRGGMAEVYLAEQESLRRPVAFKVLKRSLAGDETYVRRFQYEAQAAARLGHSNIVQIYEVGHKDGVRFIAQEYVPGQNLKEYLTRHGRGLDAALVLHIMRQVGAALAKAAQANITHRDIKPENIMLSRTGEVKVADFGLARVDGDSLALTQVGLTMGTPLYMSPEQVEGKAVDPRSDLYSFGVTCYHMLAGRPPFQGETALAVAVQHLKHEPQSLAELRPDVQRECPQLIGIVHRLLAKKPDERFGSAAELLREMKGLPTNGGDDIPWDPVLLATGPIDAVRPLSVTAATQQLQKVLLEERKKVEPIRARMWLAPVIIVAACLSTAGIGAAAAYYIRPRPLLEFDPQELPNVEKFDTPHQQWFFATMATKNVEQAWKAVEQYFPPDQSPINQRYARSAKIGLANYYRSQRQFSSAFALYQELAALGEQQAEFRLNGLAGEAIVLDEMGRKEEAREMLNRVVPRWDQVKDGTLRSGVEQLAAKYKITLPPQ